MTPVAFGDIAATDIYILTVRSNGRFTTLHDCNLSLPVPDDRV